MKKPKKDAEMAKPFCLRVNFFQNKLSIFTCVKSELSFSLWFKQS